MQVKQKISFHRYRKTGYGGHGGWSMTSYPSEKSTKIQSFFHISITALAFLAFAGYLLCMIVQAIKSKGSSLSLSVFENAVHMFELIIWHVIATGTTYAIYPNIGNLMNGGTGVYNGISPSSGSVALKKRRPNGRRKRRNIVASSINNTTGENYEFNDSTSINMLPSSLEMYDAFILCAEDYSNLYKYEKY